MLEDLAMNSNRHDFESIDRKTVPHTRKSKHHGLIEQILREIGDLHVKKALKIPRAAFGSAKIEHIRAALSRAAARKRLELATSSDEKYFYVWREG